MKVTLIVTTYQWPRALARVLQSVATQSTPPDELIIADDGSGDETRHVIGQYARSLTVPLTYVRQTHQGFRLARLRNLALAAATGDYLVFIDGDMVLHPEFLADHSRIASHGHYCQGVRIPLDQRATQSVLQGDNPPTLWQSGLAGRRRWHAWHLPRYQRALQGLGRLLLAVKGCNQGFWREHLLTINGYDEEFIGWGAEDKDLCGRLELSGVRRIGLVGGGLAYHLHHAPADRGHAERNRQRFEHTMASRHPRTTRGVDQHRVI